MSHRHVVNLTSPRLTCSGWQKRLVEKDISLPRACECVGILTCGSFRKEGAVKLLQIEPRNVVSRCVYVLQTPIPRHCGAPCCASSVPINSLLGIISQNSPLIHHKLPVNLVVWSCGYVRALRAAGSGFDPRFRHSLGSSG